jgi:hypothetical protein
MDAEEGTMEPHREGHIEEGVQRQNLGQGELVIDVEDVAVVFAVAENIVMDQNIVFAVGLVATGAARFRVERKENQIKPLLSEII